MASLYEYIGAVFQNWFLYMTAGPFLADELFKRVCPKTRERLGKRFPSRVRRRIEVAILFIGVFYAGYAAFKEEQTAKNVAENEKTKVESEITALRNATPVPMPPFQIIETDKEARDQIKELKQELVAAQETIRRQQTESDPLGKPIVSAQVDIVIKFAERVGDKTVSGVGSSLISVALGEQRAISLGSNEPAEPLLIADAGQYQISDNELHAVANIRFDSRVVGTTIRSLKSATFLHLELPPDIRSEAAGGKVTFVINGSISLAFKIPPQTAIQRIGGVNAYQIFDVKETLRALDSKQP